MVAGALEDVKLVSDVVTNVVTIAAIVVGGGWALWVFARERTRWPKADLELALSHRPLTDDELLLSAKVKIHNAGRGLMTLSSVRVDIRQVLPLSDEIAAPDNGAVVAKDEIKASWPQLTDPKIKRWAKGKEPEIEPGENDAVDFDFVVPRSLETVYVYVFAANARKKRDTPVGWPITSYYDLAGESGGESAMNLVARKA